MTRLALLCSAVLLTVLAVACANAKAPAQADLLHRRFVLATVDGDPFPAMNPPDIEFNEGFRVSGRICNRYTGLGTLENGVLTVGQMATTKMLCPDDTLNRFETMFAAMLAAGVKVDLEDDRLRLSQGGHVLVFTARDWVR
ncbi:MAG: META domain-containing protein [Deltaproteobacteria bacterium]|nr:META domain-containing protein [Deltaproteobacteria bacterium]